MSTTNSIFHFTITSLHVPQTCNNNKIQALSLDRNGFLTSSMAKSLRSIKTSSEICKSRDVSIRCNIDPSGFSPPGSWKAWMVGMLLTMIIPFWKNKWAPLLQLKSKVEEVVQTVEDITEAIEKVANKVEDMAEDMAEKLPAGKLKKAVVLIEKVADRVGKDAHLADEVIDKLQEVDEEMETFFTHVATEANEIAHEANEIAKEAKEISKEANEIVKEVQEVAKETNEIVKEVNEMNKKEL